jgi:hypothetical protein
MWLFPPTLGFTQLGRHAGYAMIRDGVPQTLTDVDIGAMRRRRSEPATLNIRRRRTGDDDGRRLSFTTAGSVRCG